MEMVLYIVIWQDRHSDTEAYPFFNKEKAIEFCRKMADENCRGGEVEEREIKGWEFFIEYSCEGDHLHITKHTMKRKRRVKK